MKISYQRGAPGNAIYIYIYIYNIYIYIIPKNLTGIYKVKVIFPTYAISVVFILLLWFPGLSKNDVPNLEHLEEIG